MSTLPPSLCAESRSLLGLPRRDLLHRNGTQQATPRALRREVLDPLWAVIMKWPKNPRRPLAHRQLSAVSQGLAAASWHVRSEVFRVPCE